MLFRSFILMACLAMIGCSSSSENTTTTTTEPEVVEVEVQQELSYDPEVVPSATIAHIPVVEKVVMEIEPKPVGPDEYSIHRADCGYFKIDIDGVGEIQFPEAEEMEGLPGYYRFTTFRFLTKAGTLYGGEIQGAGEYYANCLNGNAGVGAFTYNGATYIMMPRTRGADDLPNINTILMVKDGEVTSADIVDVFYEPAADRMVPGLVQAAMIELQATIGKQLM